MKNLYGDLFSRAYRMNYEAFTCLYSLLKNGMKDCLEQKDNSSSFYVHNGPIGSEVHLLMALQYFAGGSYLDIKPWPLNSLVSPKLDLTTVLVVLMVCCCGWKSQANNNVQRLVLIVANSTVEEKVNTDSTFKQCMMPPIILLMRLCSTQQPHQTICHLSHLL